MEHSRVNLMTLDPLRVGDVVRYLENKVAPALQEEPGYMDMTIMVNPELAVLVAESFWVSGDAMRSTERVEDPLRKEASRLGMATVSVERHELASTTRIHRAQPGAGGRLTRIDFDPKRVDEAIAAYEDTTIPWLTETNGFCSGLLLVHRTSGRAIWEEIWREETALISSRSPSASIRRDAMLATDGEIRALEEFQVERAAF
jgi:hypothetical protein